MPQSARMRIGKVVELLRPEFPDVSISKLRFLEDQGLVEPQRTPGGYRMYTDAEIAKLRAILEMQRDEFLPLRVIRDEINRRLQNGQSGNGSRTIRLRNSSAASGASATARPLALDTPAEAWPVIEACERADVTPRFADECRAWDLIAGTKGADGVWRLDADEVAVLRAAARLTKLGVDLCRLRQLRSAASQPAALVEHYAAARLRAPSDDEQLRARDAVNELAAAALELVGATLARDVRSTLAGDLSESSRARRPYVPTAK